MNTSTYFHKLDEAQQQARVYRLIALMLFAVCVTLSGLLIVSVKNSNKLLSNNCKYDSEYMGECVK